MHQRSVVKTRILWYVCLSKDVKNIFKYGDIKYNTKYALANHHLEYVIGNKQLIKSSTLYKGAQKALLDKNKNINNIVNILAKNNSYLF